MYPPKHFLIDGSTVNDTAESESYTSIEPQLITLIEHNPLATLILKQTLPDDINPEKGLTY